MGVAPVSTRTFHATKPMEFTEVSEFLEIATPPRRRAAPRPRCERRAALYRAGRPISLVGYPAVYIPATRFIAKGRRRERIVGPDAVTVVASAYAERTSLRTESELPLDR